MQQLSQSTATSREHAGGELEQLRSFVHDLAAAILANANDLEGVWNITNRVYDRWSSAEKIAELRSEQKLALSA